jgi:hypothetical protein
MRALVSQPGSEMPVTNEEAMQAVYDDELEGLLKSLGIHSAFVHKKLKCAFCKDTITWDNLQSLFPDSGSVKCSCSRPECVKALTERLAPSGLKEPRDSSTTSTQEDRQPPNSG